MAIVAPFLREDDLRRLADQFLLKHHQSRSIPVPIERIIENDFGMDIVPMPGLKAHFDVDAFLTNDLLEIRVDQAVWESRQNRYRFSLAHELAHKLLHPDVFQQLAVSSIDQWKAARNLIPEREYRFIEWHANAFAGLVLVPPERLSEEFERGKENLANVGISIDDAGPVAWDWIIEWLAQRFQVSQQVISTRGPRDNLWEA